jgi:membrane associated rhomboid family serine protease
MVPRDPFSRRPPPRSFAPAGFGAGGMPPRDLLVLLAVLLFTFSLGFFAATAAVPALLGLTPLVWQRGFLWQLVTYPFVGNGQGGFFFLLELLVLFWFGRDVRRDLGLRRFWRLLLTVSLIAGVVAVAVQALTGVGAVPFLLMQGQRMILAILVAAFATLHRNATILLFFVLPIEARWFLGIEILIAFVGFLPTHDLAGFLGICTAVGATWITLAPGGPRRRLRDLRLRMEQWWIRRRLEAMKRKRKLRVISGGPGDRVHRGATH